MGTDRRVKQFLMKVESCPDCPYSSWYKSRWDDESGDRMLECTEMNNRNTEVEIPDWCPLDDWGDIKACIKLLGQRR